MSTLGFESEFADHVVLDGHPSDNYKVIADGIHIATLHARDREWIVTMIAPKPVKPMSIPQLELAVDMALRTANQLCARLMFERSL